MENKSHYLVDSHVHFHDCFDQNLFFDRAAFNFQKGALELGIPSDTTGCLFFTETSKDHFFRQLCSEAGQSSNKEWAFSKTLEEHSLLARKEGFPTLLIIAGRQIVTRERLEVLALGCHKEFTEDLSLAETVERVEAQGALPVVPWGFGKWTGKRRKILTSFLTSRGGRRFYLGDNSGRPQLSKKPPLFDLARSLGMFVLPGSDPLPFKSHAKTPGRYGFYLSGNIDLDFPAEALKSLIGRLQSPPPFYGRRENLLRFCFYQAVIQIENIKRINLESTSYRSPTFLFSSRHTPKCLLSDKGDGSLGNQDRHFNLRRGGRL